MPVPTTEELELLTFLSDPNGQVRQVAVEHVASFSAKGHPSRQLLTQSSKLLRAITDGGKGRLMGRGGKECDPIEDLKALCKDQPISAHDAFSALINLTDTLDLCSRIGDEPFLTFLVSYIADPVSLLADLACMLLSNLTKFEAIAARLLSLQVKSAPYYSFMSVADMDAALRGMELDPSAPDYEEQRKKAEAAQKKLVKEAEEKQKREQEEKTPALSRLLDAFEEGATVNSNESAIESMKRKVNAAQQQQGESSTPSSKIKRKSNCNFLASVFANVTIIPAGREWFVKPLNAASAAASRSAQQMAAEVKDDKAEAIEYPVARIMVFTEHPDLIRRGGVISALKNILFIKSAHKLLIAPPPSPRSDLPPHTLALFSSTPRPSSSLDLLPYLLLPLTDGSELASLDMEDQESLPEACQFVDEGKKREKDPALRLMLVECLLLLCTGLYGRECLRHRGAYIVVREAHLREEDEKITEAVVRLVNILQRDESENTLQDAEAGAGKPEERPEQATKSKDDGSSSGGGKLLGEIDVGAERPPGTVQAEDEEEEEEDEDLVIQEL